MEMKKGEAWNIEDELFCFFGVFVVGGGSDAQLGIGCSGDRKVGTHLNGRLGKLAQMGGRTQGMRGEGSGISDVVGLGGQILIKEEGVVYSD